MIDNSSPTGSLVKLLITEQLRNAYLNCDMCGQELVVGHMCFIDVRAGIVVHPRYQQDGVSCYLKYIELVLTKRPDLKLTVLQSTLGVSLRTLFRYKEQLRERQLI